MLCVSHCMFLLLMLTFIFFIQILKMTKCCYHFISYLNSPLPKIIKQSSDENLTRILNFMCASRKQLSIFLKTHFDFIFKGQKNCMIGLSWIPAGPPQTYFTLTRAYSRFLYNFLDESHTPVNIVHATNLQGSCTI